MSRANNPVGNGRHLWYARCCRSCESPLSRKAYLAPGTNEACQDNERMGEISHEIGLEAALAKLGVGASNSDKTLTSPSPDHSSGEKAIVEREENELV